MARNPTPRWLAVLIGGLVIVLTAPAASAVRPGTWEDRPPAPIRRNEASHVFVNGEFHLLGMRKQHDVYDPTTETWSRGAPLPLRVSMVQAVVLGGKIYVIGGVRRWRLPSKVSGRVQIYDPATNTWSEGAKMPRPRGAGGVAVYKGKIYYAGGIRRGGQPVPYFDVYNPASDTWKKLPNMPVGRDHFHAAVASGAFWAIGGRRYRPNLIVNRVDRFNFRRGMWLRSKTKRPPVPTAGYAIARYGRTLVLFGGEGGYTVKGAVQAYHTKRDRWRKFARMPHPRHGMQAAKCAGGAYIATGSTKQGNFATSIHDVFFLKTPQPCG
ncbi:MAG TPA: kelch repeat-containing protein [Actinomycetota bacterium]|nr:kelch repeat-containing protein [Actinomycetota bacterium]